MEPLKAYDTQNYAKCSGEHTDHLFTRESQSTAGTSKRYPIYRVIFCNRELIPKEEHEAALSSEGRFPQSDLSTKSTEEEGDTESSVEDRTEGQGTETETRLESFSRDDRSVSPHLFPYAHVRLDGFDSEESIGARVRDISDLGTRITGPALVN